MAVVLTAYATAAEYRERTGDKSTGSDTTLDAQLLATSRSLERVLWVVPGAFNSAADVTYTFDGTGERVLPLRDRAGYCYFLQSVTANKIEIDTDLDGTADYALDFEDAWVRGLPENAAAGSEPFDSIELIPHASATVTKFPDLPASVSITGTWGWAAVPGLVKELVIHRTHELREGHKGGAVGAFEGFDGSVPMQPHTFWLWKEAERLYGRKVPFFA